MAGIYRFLALVIAFAIAAMGTVWFLSQAQRGNESRSFAEIEASDLLLNSMVVRDSALSDFAQTRRESLLTPYAPAGEELAGNFRLVESYVDRGDGEGVEVETMTDLSRRWGRSADAAIAAVRRGQPISYGSVLERNRLISAFEAANDRHKHAIATEADARNAEARTEALVAILVLSISFGVVCIAVLGWERRKLGRRVARSNRERQAQQDFTEMMQIAGSEAEAYALVKRHLERSIARSEVVVLRRNNSENRLEPATPLSPGSALAERLLDSSPQSCLAARRGRPQERSLEHQPLLDCELCCDLDRTTCVPSLVGGAVIGSVLVSHPAPLDERTRTHVIEAVGQSAPVLANLRNLAVAEVRAATDALTGLPNSRALSDNLARMVAQAARSVQPLAAILCDLDHFKKINDVYGHDKGDQALAAASATLRAGVRESDLAGRFGGEEFLVLLPDTTLDGAAVVAEKLREELSRIHVPGVEAGISASFGVAVFPTDAPDPARLLRIADRALYAAKSRGRNCVVTSAELLAEPVAQGAGATMVGDKRQITNGR